MPDGFRKRRKRWLGPNYVVRRWGLLLLLALAAIAWLAHNAGSFPHLVYP